MNFCYSGFLINGHTIYRHSLCFTETKIIKSMCQVRKYKWHIFLNHPYDTVYSKHWGCSSQMMGMAWWIIISNNQLEMLPLKQKNKGTVYIDLTEISRMFSLLPWASLTIMARLCNFRTLDVAFMKWRVYMFKRHLRTIYYGTLY